ncbi:MAG: hypothetical protein N2485_00835 [bacterium]|nr:hypothetical protein [bacterium]
MKKINKNNYKIHLVKISALINLKKIEECQNYIESIFDLELQEEEFILFESILEILNISKEIKTNFYKNMESIENRIKKINENIEKLKEYDKTIEKEFLQDLINTLFMINDYKLMRFFINWQSFI